MGVTLNKIHNIIWSTAQNAWVVVSEGTKSRSKSGVSALKIMAALLLLSPAGAMAATLPQGGVITVGEGAIVGSGANQIIIKQNSDKLGINWQSFNVGADGHVIFDQPGSGSIALNRVVGADGSSILGKISANGQVFLINPNGVIFGKSSKVNVGGLVASTMDISDADFTAGNYAFKAGSGQGSVSNLGTLQASDGGYVALLGRNVGNHGVIQAQLGTVAMAAGDSVVLDFAGDGLLNLQVDRSTVDVLVSNHGLLKADGGSVLMTARSGNQLAQTVINNDGVIEAHTVGLREGKIFLDGGIDDGAVRVAGKLDASAPMTGNGGFIETSGKTVIVDAGTVITTQSQSGDFGTWLVDPTDFTISSGNASKTTSGIGADTLMASLALSNVVLQTAAAGSDNGDINVNSDITWAANTKLTLTAAGTINVNANINVNGTTGKLALNYSSSTYGIADGKSINLAGASTKYLENGENVIIIRTLDDLKLLDDSSNEWSKFALAGDIDASDTVNWNAGLGYKPAVMDGTFYGHLNGLGHAVNNLFIDRPTQDNVGLIGKMEDSKVYNINVNGSISGKDNVGLLVGSSDSGVIRNISTSGSVSGEDNVGGVAGYLNSGNATNVGSSANVAGVSVVGGVFGNVTSHSLKYLHSAGNVVGHDIVGGVVGRQESGTLSFSYALGAVSGDSMIGGVLGYSTSSDVSTSYASGDVTGTGTAIGGLIGQIYDGAVTESFSTSKVIGVNEVGGLAGHTDKIDIESSYATGSVSGNDSVGGLTGFANNVYLDFTYASGLVAGGSNVGGLVGSGTDVHATEAYWDMTRSGLSTSAGGIGKLDLTDASIFSGWDIALAGGSDKTWRIYDGSTGPLLRAFMGSATAAPGTNHSTTYDGSVINSSDVPTGSLTIDSDNNFFKPKSGEIEFALTSGGSAIRNAGAYTLDGYSSSQFGYDITESTKTTLVVNKATLDITVGADNKVYDGLATATGSLSDNRFASDDLVITADLAFDSKNAGANKTVSATGINVTGADAGNYTWATTGVTTADINKAVLNVTATGGDKVYDGSTLATSTLADNRISGDDLVLSSTGSNFGDKNAGIGKVVNVTGITVAGADAGNYTWNSDAVTTGNVDKANLTVSAAGVDKTYDSTTAAGAILGDNRIVGDDLTLAYSQAEFSDKNAGTGKAINVDGISATGVDAGNYTWNTDTTTTANIAKADLVIDAVAQDKVYDGSLATTSVLSDNRISGDSLVIASSGSDFFDKNAGAGKTVVVSGITVTGADAVNYNWSDSAITTAEITKATLSVTAHANDKTYDGTNTASATLSDNRVAGDVLSLSNTGSTFSDKNAGMGKLVTVTGLALTGADASNYVISSTASTTATINKANLVVSANASDKTYDGDTTASTILSDNRVSGDDLNIGSLASNFADKNAGAGKVVTVDGISVTGADADNYTWNTTGATTAGIAKASLNVSATGQDKTYDSSTTASATLGDNRIGSDDLTITAGTVEFGDKNAGIGKTVNVDGISVSGADAANYDWNTSAVTTANISKAVLHVTASGQDKTYDGSTTAGVILTDNRIGSDDLTIGSTGALFADKNAGAGKTVSIGGITVTGLDAQNYTWNAVTSTTASIFKAILNISALAQNKSYDGTDAANVSLTDNRIVGDDIASSAGNSVFTDKNFGSGKHVTVSDITLSGADAANYTFNTSATTTADISKANLTVKADSTGKVEGTVDGALSWSLQSGNLFGSDTVNGTLTRDAGESEGVYGISKGTLTAGANYDLTVVPGAFEIKKAASIPPVVVDPTPPVVIPPTVIPETPKALETTKQIISTITVASKQAGTPATQAEPAKAHQSDSSVIISDYRLLNLGMKLPDEIFSEDSSKR